jgi:hypothetical protein
MALRFCRAAWRCGFAALHGVAVLPRCMALRFCRAATLRDNTAAFFGSYRLNTYVDVILISGSFKSGFSE